MDHHEQQRDVHDQLLADFQSLWRPVGKGRPVPGGKNLSTVYSIIILITPLVLTIHTAKSKFRSTMGISAQRSTTARGTANSYHGQDVVPVRIMLFAVGLHWEGRRCKEVAKVIEGR